MKFPIGLIALYILIYLGYNAYLNPAFDSEDAVFIWGDSQAYQGIDIPELANTLDKEVYSAANHGAGVYDFLVFTQQVPENSEVIVAISNLVQVRRKEKDYNRSGFSFWSMKSLYQNGYSLNELFSISKLNIKPRRNILASTKLYPYSDSIQKILPISHFEKYFNDSPEFLDSKQN
ncbi:MAG: hypothetical protein HRU26_07285, partial [Psychroserpens sp.]|nr:hypothetical protein [Psychroserpens sp.]